MQNHFIGGVPTVCCVLCLYAVEEEDLSEEEAEEEEEEEDEDIELDESEESPEKPVKKPVAVKNGGAKVGTRKAHSIHLPFGCSGLYV